MEYDPELDVYELDAALSVSKRKDTAGFVTMQDVESVIGWHVEKGSYAETHVRAVLELCDGNFAYVDASCDTTGWDCQAHGLVSVQPSLDELILHGVPKHDRQWFMHLESGQRSVWGLSWL